MTTEKTSNAELILRAARGVEAVYSERAAGSDLTARQIDVLLILIDEPGGISQMEMRARSFMDRSTLSSVVARLIESRHVAQAPDKDDRRARIHTLTAKGSKAALRARAIKAEVDAEIDRIVANAQGFSAKLAMIWSEKEKLEEQKKAAA